MPLQRPLAGIQSKVLGLLSMLLLSAIPLTAASLLSTIPVGKTPGEVVLNPAAHLVYVVNQGSNTVSVIDSQTLVVKNTISVGSKPTGIAANPAANLVYVANAGSGNTSLRLRSGQASITPRNDEVGCYFRNVGK